MSLKISDYGLIGNCRSSALISKLGAISWCCLPHFDSPSFFASLLDTDRGGSFSLTPEFIIDSHQEYRNNTNVLETYFSTSSGSAILHDCFSVLTEKEKRNNLYPATEILRVIEGISGEVSVTLHFEPRPDYGKEKISIRSFGKLGFRCEHKLELLFFQTSVPEKFLEIKSEHERSYITARFKLKAGEKFVFSLSYSQLSPAIIPPLCMAEERLQLTINFWEKWISQCTYEGPYLDHVKRSALALKLLTFAPSGAIVAAPTTSLPELIGGVRNWDYRYCWLRDASFTVRSFVAIGFFEEARAYVNWMLHTTHLTSPRLKVLYSLFGESKIPEKLLPWLRGFDDSHPVRIGNAADLQFQLDVYGEVLNAIYYYAPSTKEFDQSTKNFVLNLGKSVCELWQKPDEGIWEVRSEKVHHTHSKVLAWVALDRIEKLAGQYNWRAPMEKFRKIRDEIRTSIEANAFNEELGAYTRSYQGEELDASVLVLPLVEYCHANSERMKATTERIVEKLSQNGLIYRYRAVDDGLPGQEGAFGICNFWMVQNLAKAGRIEEATEWFNSMVERSNSLGLWSEEIDPENGEYLGNYPQAFSHTGLINAALTLSQEMRKKGPSL